MTALRFELRRGSGASMCALLVALGLIVAWKSVSAPPAIWPLVVSSLGDAVSVMGPLAAAGAAYAAARASRRRTCYLEDGSARGRSAAPLAELGALLTWVAAAYALVVAVLFGDAATSATWSHPDVTRTAAAGAGLLVYVVLGYVTGRVAPRRFTPLVVAFVLYGTSVYLTGSRQGTRVLQLLPVDRSLYDEFNVLNSRVAPGQLLWYVGFAVVLVASWVWLRQRGHAPLLALGAGSILGALGALILLPQNGDAIVGGAVRTEWTCRQEIPPPGLPEMQLCLHPALAALAPQVSGALMPLAVRLAGTPFQISRLEQRPRGIGSVATPGSVAFALDDGRARSLHLLAPDTAVNALHEQDSCWDPTSGQRPGGPYAQLVAAWLAGQPSVFRPIVEEERRAQQFMESLDPAEARAWITSHAGAIRGCDLTGADFTVGGS